MLNNKTVEELIVERERTYSTIRNQNDIHKQIITTLNNKIDDIEKLLYEQCNHEWQYQPPQIYERASEYCKICNLVNKGR